MVSEVAPTSSVNNGSPGFSNSLQRTLDQALAQRMQRSMPGAADAIGEQRRNYKSFIDRSRNGKPKVVHIHASDSDLATRASASDWGFNLFRFDLAPKIARIFNVPKGIPLNRIAENAEEIAIIWSTKRIENSKAKPDCSSYQIITSDEASASRIVAHFNGIHFHYLKVRAVRPKLPVSILDGSILLWNIAIDLSDVDLVQLFSFCGQIRDC
jgi:hypothetical protein